MTSDSRAAASERCAPAELLIKWRPGAPGAEREALLARLGAQRLRRFEFIGVEHVRLAAPDMGRAVALLAADPCIEYAEPNYELRAEAIPNDPRFSELWGLHNTGQTGGTPGADIHAPEAWDVTTGDAGLRIGVIDTGIDYTHPDLAANAWTNAAEAAGIAGVDDDGNGYVDDVHGYDFVNGDGDPFDDNGHGTHCAGAIAASGNDGIGVVGAAWRAQMVAIKFMDAAGAGTIANAIAALQYAIAADVKLTSDSWGGGGFSQALRDAIEAAGEAGQLFVATAGRSGTDLDLSPRYPACYDTPHILVVTASDDADALADFANYGAQSVDLAAPGIDILSTLPGAIYGSQSGTSPSTAYVSGVCALVLARFPALTHLGLKDWLIQTVDVTPSLSGRVLSDGRVNAFRAVASGPVAVERPVPPRVGLGAIHPNPTRGSASFSLGLPRSGMVEIGVYSMSGRRIAWLAREAMNAGSHRLTWNGRDRSGRPVPAGIYYVSVLFEGRRVSRAIASVR